MQLMEIRNQIFQLKIFATVHKVKGCIIVQLHSERFIYLLLRV